MPRLLLGMTLMLSPALVWAQGTDSPVPPESGGAVDPAAMVPVEALPDPAVPPAPETSPLPADPAPAADPGPVAALPEGGATAAAPAGPADPTIELFVKKCASCHTVGKGDRVGPDLKGVLRRRDPAWVKRFVLEPSKMVDTDPVAREMVKKFLGVKMPDLGLGPEKVAALVALIDRCGVEVCDLVPKFTPVSAATPADVVAGEAIFLGHLPLGAGGPACISCHTVDGHAGGIGGGRLAKNLTHAFARLGDEGIHAALSNPTFKLMNRVYGEDHPLEAAEVFSLRAFLNEANRTPAPKDDSPNLLFFAILSTAVLLIILNTAWSRRLRGVRKVITQRRKNA